jgi:hypothetical protein
VVGAAGRGRHVRADHGHASDHGLTFLSTVPPTAGLVAKFFGTAKKKGLVLQPALKGSLNLKVSKGPEETTCRN